MQGQEAKLKRLQKVLRTRELALRRAQVAASQRWRAVAEGESSYEQMRDTLQSYIAQDQQQTMQRSNDLAARRRFFGVLHQAEQELQRHCEQLRLQAAQAQERLAQQARAKQGLAQALAQRERLLTIERQRVETRHLDEMGARYIS